MRESRVSELEKKWMSNSEAQAYLGVSAGFLANLRDTAKLSYYKVGKSLFYKVRDLDRLIERNRVL